MEDSGEFIDFMVRYKDWVAIKRMAIRPETKEEEIAYHLSSIENSIDSKIYKILGINTDELDKLAGSLGSKKGADSLSDALKMLDSKEMKAKIKGACKTETVAPLARAYLLNRIMAKLNFPTSVTPEALEKLFPETKIRLPGRLGRKAKSQKGQ